MGREAASGASRDNGAMDAVGLAGVALAVALLFAIANVLRRSSGFVGAWLAGRTGSLPGPPPGVQEDDDFRWGWAQPQRPSGAAGDDERPPATAVAAVRARTRPRPGPEG